MHRTQREERGEKDAHIAQNTREERGEKDAQNTREERGEKDAQKRKINSYCTLWDMRDEGHKLNDAP